MAMTTDWNPVLRAEFAEPYWQELQTFLAEERSRHTIYPPDDQVFAALHLTPLADVSVVILGQDPYHGPGQAEGLAFSVRPPVAPPPSLRNIFKELTADLGIEAVEVLLPVDLDEACAPQSADLADAVFVVETAEKQARVARPKLGVMIEGSDDGVRVMEVVADSVAARSGLEEGDLIQRAAGFEVQTAQQLVDVIQRQAAGTWLPLEVRRDEESIELIARFPQSFDN